jgi:hypothetical protein
VVHASALFLIAALLVFAIVKPRWAILLYILLLGWTPAGIGQNLYFRLDYEDIALFVIAMAALRIILVSPQACWTPVTKILIVYWVGSVLANTIGLAKDPNILDPVARQMSKDFSLLLLFSALSGCLHDIAYFRKVALATFVATIGVAASVYIGRFFPHAPIVQYWVIPPMTGDRSPGMFASTYLAGEYMVVGVSLLVAYYFYSSSLWKKPLCVGASLAYLVAILYGQSRATYLAIGVIVLVAMISRVRNFMWGVLLVIIATALIASEPLLVQHVVERFQGKYTAKLGGRLESWSMWIAVTTDVSWFLGNGFQYSAIKSHIGGHSSYLEAWSDAGVVGLCAFLAFWPVVLKTRRSILASPLLADGDRAAGMGFCFAAIGLLISSMVIGYITDTYYRTIFLLVMTLAAAPCLSAACWTPQFAFRPRLVPRTSFQ